MLLSVTSSCVLFLCVAITLACIASLGLLVITSIPFKLLKSGSNSRYVHANTSD